MDLFSHVLVAYLLTAGVVGFHPQYLAAGALAGGLPDADALLYPLARRFPTFRHHGITHSLTGVTVVAVVGAFVAPILAGGSSWVYFVVFELGGVAHIAQDGFTHYSVPPLLPFSDRPLELDADRAINGITLVVSVVGFYVLLVVERGQVAFAIYEWTLYVLAAFFGAYFVLRLSVRYRLGRRIRASKEFTAVIPTTNPFRWYLIGERRANGRLSTTVAEYRVGRGVVGTPRRLEVPLEAEGPTGPVSDERSALERSYPLARRASRFLADSFHFGEVSGNPQDGFTAVWYSLEFSAFGRAAAVKVTFPPGGGAPTVRRGWHVVRSRAPVSRGS